MSEARESLSHAAGNPGEDSAVPDDERHLTVGGSAADRAIDPFEHPEVRWDGEQDDDS